MASLAEYDRVPGIMQEACPFCKAQPGNRCKPPGGIPGTRNNKPHKARIEAAQKARAGSE